MFAAVAARSRAGVPRQRDEQGADVQLYALFLMFMVIIPPIISATTWVMSPTLLRTVVSVARKAALSKLSRPEFNDRTRKTHVLTES